MPRVVNRDEDVDSGRPTVVPPFNVAAFARQSETMRAVVPLAEETALEAAHRLAKEGEPEQALFHLARLLEEFPLHVDALVLSAQCSTAVERDCLATIGPGSSLLVVAASPEALKSSALDSVSGFLLSLMDGKSDVDTILDLSGLPRLLALRHLRGLVDRKLVVSKRHPLPR